MDHVFLVICLLLGHESFALRSAAQERLESLGGFAMPALAVASERGSLHVRCVSAQLMAAIDGKAIRGILGEAEWLPWISAMPMGCERRDDICAEYLAQAEKLSLPVVWTDQSQRDWLVERLATWLWIRDSSPDEFIINGMWENYNYWLARGRYPWE